MLEKIDQGHYIGTKTFNVSSVSPDFLLSLLFGAPAIFGQPSSFEIGLWQVEF